MNEQVYPKKKYDMTISIRDIRVFFAIIDK